MENTNNLKMIITENAPAAIGPYSQAIISNGLIYTSGQIPLDPIDGELVKEDIALQTERSILNIKAILEAAGADLGKVVKTTCFLSDMKYFSDFNKVYENFFTGKPARSCVAVKELPRNAMVEIEAIATL